MSAATLAIRARHAARRRHSASIRDLRADRHPNEPHSGPLRPLRAVGGTLGDTRWIGPPWRLAAAALPAYHRPLGCSVPSSTPSPRPGDGRHRVPFA